MSLKLSLLVVVVNREEGLPKLDRKLCDSYNSSKDFSMKVYLLPISVDLLQNSPVLESLVDCLLSVSHPLLHCFILYWIGKAHGALDIFGSLSNVSIISFNSFPLFKISHESIPEDCNVMILATREGSIDPNYLSCLNAKPNLISKSRLHVELVA